LISLEMGRWHQACSVPPCAKNHGALLSHELLMSMEEISELIEHSVALVEADRRVVEAVVQEKFDILDDLIADFRSKRIEAQTLLAPLAAVENVDEETRDLLLRVQGKFRTDQLIDLLAGGDINAISFYDPYDDKNWDFGADLLHSWMTHDDYVR